MKEKEKMLAGLPYCFEDVALLEDRMLAREKWTKYNLLHFRAFDEKREILKSLFTTFGEMSEIEQPFRCDYGYQISWGKQSFANYNLTILDTAKVQIGDNVKIGPNVSLITVNHPLLANERNVDRVEYGREITIKNGVWIGACVTVLPGVTIGENAVIGAGSVVTHDIDANVVAVGNPCRVLREITDKDKIEGKF